jgi:hypothetical protein
MPEPENKYNQWLKKLTHKVLVRNIYTVKPKRRKTKSQLLEQTVKRQGAKT